MKRLYLLLALLGTVLPYAVFLPWLQQYGLNLPLLLHMIMQQPLAAFAWLDVLVSALALLVFVHAECRRSGMSYPWLLLPVLFGVGVSLALPLFLYWRERHLQKQQGLAAMRPTPVV